MRVAVIGVGAMGRNHARVYNELDHAELVAVADINPVLADKVAHQFRTRSYADYRELLAKEKPDAVTIAAPKMNLVFERRQHLRKDWKRS